MIIAALLAAVLLRAWAVLLLPTDFDEPVYVRAAIDYARALRSGDLNGIIDYPQNREHPALVKLLYAGAVLALGPGATFQPALIASRTVSAMFGTAAVLVLALAGGPLTAGMLAIHTLTIKYTSQAYLEALPMLASLVAVLAFVRLPPRALAERPRFGRWFWTSALALGLTAAAKFSYVPVVLVVILYLATWEKNIQWLAMIPYFLVAGAVFWLADPTLWHEPVSRLAGAVTFHAAYGQGTAVQQAAYPWYQPLLWVTTSAPAIWHPAVFFYYGFDGFMFLFAVLGLQREWRERRWVVIWLMAGLILLLLWPTKWPQYALIVVPAVCLAAGMTVERAYRWVRQQNEYWDWLPQMMPELPWYFWLVTGLSVGFVVVIYMWGLLGVVLGSIGWSHLTAQNSLMPSNAVQALLTDAAGRVFVGTDNGVAVWSPPTSTDSPSTPILFNTRDSGLPNDHVLSLAQDHTGGLWFGTAAGLAEYDGRAWHTFGAAELGLKGDQVQALAVGSAGQLYAGTLTGAAVWDGQRWSALPQAGAGHTTGLADPRVLSLAVGRAASGDKIWFGTLTGVSVLATATGEWRNYSLTDMQAGVGGVAGLLADSAGRVWAATQGGGLSVWDGQTWQNDNAANSGLPYSLVNAAYEVSPGTIWVATGLPNAVGGAVTSFDGRNWHAFLPRNSGFSGAEPVAMTVDRQGRIWVGTRSAGIDLYQSNR